MVTPLLINNINLINDKQRERRARGKNEMNDNFLNNKVCPIQKDKSWAVCKSSDGTQKSKSVSCPSSGNSLVRIKIVPHDFPIPTIVQVKDFFLNKLSGNYLNGVLETIDRETEAEKFFNHYESNGWLLGGKVPMRNWKAACRSWVAKIPYFSRNELKRSNHSRIHAKPVLNYAKPL